MAVVLAYTALGAQPAQAKVSCGDVITEDTKLKKDLNCSGLGLEIDADDVTLDLNGHTIKGDGGNTGVLVEGQTGVKIKDGTVKGFTFGVLLEGTDDSTVRQVKARNNANFGIAVFDDSDNNTIERNTASGNGFGIFVADGSDGNRVKQNTANGNDNFGIEIGDSDDNVVEENTTNGNNRDGIGVASDTTGTVLRANHADHNDEEGIEVDASDNGTSIGDNVANDNHDLGINADPGTDDAGGNKAHGNGNPQQCAGVSCS